MQRHIPKQAGGAGSADEPRVSCHNFAGAHQIRDHDWLRTDNLVRTADFSAVEPYEKQIEVFRDLSLVIRGHHHFSAPLRLHHQIYANDLRGSLASLIMT